MSEVLDAIRAFMAAMDSVGELIKETERANEEIDLAGLAILKLLSEECRRPKGIVRCGENNIDWFYPDGSRTQTPRLYDFCPPCAMRYHWGAITKLMEKP